MNTVVNLNLNEIKVKLEEKIRVYVRKTTYNTYLSNVF